MDFPQVKLELSRALMEEHEAVSDLLDTWRGLTERLNLGSVSQQMADAIDGLDALSDELKIQSIRVFEEYRAQLKARYSPPSVMAPKESSNSACNKDKSCEDKQPEQALNGEPEPTEDQAQQQDK